MFQQLSSTACILAFTLNIFFPSESFIIPEHQLYSQIYRYPGYILHYNEKYEQADWVAYELTADEINNPITKRITNFKEDPNILTGSATDQDYYKSGYDRGHLAPAADMKFSKAAMLNSFYYSNISPQNPDLNRTLWASLEESIRNWALINKKIIVITGPIINEGNLKTIGINKVAVPNFFYKVILDYQTPEKKGIAFIIPNGKPLETSNFYACSIDKVEEITGSNFFPTLSPEEEILLESKFDIKCWPFM